MHSLRYSIEELRNIYNDTVFWTMVVPYISNTDGTAEPDTK